MVVIGNWYACAGVRLFNWLTTTVDRQHAIYNKIPIRSNIRTLKLIQSYTQVNFPYKKNILKRDKTKEKLV